MVSVTTPIAAVLGFFAGSVSTPPTITLAHWGTRAAFHFGHDMCCPETWPPQFAVLAIRSPKGIFAVHWVPLFPRVPGGTAALGRTSLSSLTSISLEQGLVGLWAATVRRVDESEP